VYVSVEGLQDDTRFTLWIFVNFKAIQAQMALYDLPLVTTLENNLP